MNTKSEIYNRGEALDHLESCGFDPDHLEELVIKFRSLRSNAKHRGVACLLSLSQYVKLVTRAKITHPKQIGKKAEQFCMARHGDIGDYKWGNCRFITNAENRVEECENGGTKSATIKRSKQFKLRSPEGKVFRGRDLKAFARKHSLNQSAISSVCRNIRAHHKGWTGQYV